MDVISVDPARTREAPRFYAMLALGLAVATIAGALMFQARGMAPCELCLKERLPYYAGIAIAAVTLLLAWRGARCVTQVGFVVLALLFLFSAGFGAYHAGIEWGFWPGPADCTGTLDRAGSNADFLQQLQKVKVVRCDAVAIRILGLSLAGWNAVLSLAISVVSLAGFRAARS